MHQCLFRDGLTCKGLTCCRIVENGNRKYQCLFSNWLTRKLLTCSKNGKAVAIGKLTENGSRKYQCLFSNWLTRKLLTCWKNGKAVTMYLFAHWLTRKLLPLLGLGYQNAPGMLQNVHLLSAFPFKRQFKLFWGLGSKFKVQTLDDLVQMKGANLT